MIVTEIASEIFARLQAYELVSHYGFAEIVPDGESSIPAVYCSNGEYKHVINDYDWSEGIAYIRYNGTEITTFSDAEFIGCQDLLNIVFPTRLVIIGKRKGQTPYEVASLIRSRITGMYENVAQAYGAVYVDVTSSAIQHDIRTNLNTEFDGADVAWDTENYIISIDLNIEVLIDANCILDVGNIPPATRSLPPNIIPNGGSFAFDVTIQLTHPNPSADIYYTLDGTTPAIDQGIFYTGQFTIFQNTLVSARAFINGELPSFVSVAGFNISGVGVVILPQSGEYLENALITLLSETGTGTIYYTLNNTEPTTSSAVYSSPILITENAIVKAIVVDPPRATAPSSSATFAIKLLPPVSDTAAGIYLTQKVVNLTAVGVVEWRVDGGILNQGNTIIVSESGFYEFRDTAPNNVSSDFSGVLIEIQCAAPTISPNSGLISDSDLITITTNEPGGVTYYTIDGSEPTVNSILYTIPFSLLQNASVKAKTFRANTIPSNTVSQQYFVPALLQLITSSNTGVFVTNNNWATSTFRLTTFFSTPFTTPSIDIIGRVLYTGTGGLRITSDQFVTNQLLPIPPTATALGNVAASNDFGVVLSCNGSVNDGGSNAYVSTDGLQSFQRVILEGNQVYSNVVPAVSHDGSVLAVGGSTADANQFQRLRLSFNLGSTWTTIRTLSSGNSERIESIAFNSDGTVMYYILRTLNVTFQQLYFKRTGPSLSVETQLTVPDANAFNRNISCDATGNIVYLRNAGGIIKSTDGGATWNAVLSYTFNVNTWISCNRAGNKVLVSSAESNSSRYSGDGGQTWITVAPSSGFLTRQVNAGI